MLAAICSVSHAAAVSVVDDRGVRVTMENPARNIIALAPSITELVFAAGAGARLSGVPRFSDYPAAAKSIAQIGDATRIDLERVVSLKPDLVVAWKTGNHAADFERLEQLGFPVFVAEPGTLAALPRLIRAIASLAGTDAAGESAAAEFERGIVALDARFRSRSPVRVFYEIWHRPLMTVSGTHMISDVIALCGGINIFSAVPALTPVVSLESVIAGRPDVVLGGSSATTPEEFVEPWRQAGRYAGLRAVRAMYVDPDFIQRQTPRILAGARTVCEHLDIVRAMRQKR
ncbi:MAG TPA: cobalamin-binding protein [Burkholderiales bacterium]|jgi:iron complex transport system substrate-binding protein|nr:cobalamin-binding protein [Burkholderiales bacterium]